MRRYCDKHQQTSLMFKQKAIQLVEPEFDDEDETMITESAVLETEVQYEDAVELFCPQCGKTFGEAEFK